VGQTRILGHRTGLRPGVDPRQGDEDRHHQDGENRQGSGRGFGGAPDDQSPATAGEMIDHQDDQAAKADANGNQPGDEVGAGQLVRIDESTDDAGGNADRADNQGSPSQPFEQTLGRSEVTRLAHWLPPVAVEPPAVFAGSWKRSKSDKLSVSTAWLSCSART